MKYIFDSIRFTTFLEWHTIEVAAEDLLALASNTI